MLKPITGFLFSALIQVAICGPTEAAPKRVALVIGNAAYVSITPLQKPANDAQKMAELLRGLGYEVIIGTNANARDLETLTQRFRVAVKDAEVGFFFYSGHGFQTNRVDQQHPVNHIVPVDFTLPDAETPLATLALDVIVHALKSHARVGFIFMDACRSDPKLAAASQQLASGARSVTISRGLSPVRVSTEAVVTHSQGGGNRPTGLLIAYATDPGNIALDGERGPLSPFTSALVRHIATPGLSVGEVMGRVSADVSLETQGVQTPWNVSSLTAGTYQFVPRQPAPKSAPGKQITAPAKAQPKPKVPFQLQ